MIFNEILYFDLMYILWKKSKLGKLWIDIIDEFYKS